MRYWSSRNNYIIFIDDLLPEFTWFMISNNLAVFKLIWSSVTSSVGYLLLLVGRGRGCVGRRDAGQGQGGGGAEEEGDRHQRHEQRTEVDARRRRVVRPVAAVPAAQLRPIADFSNENSFEYTISFRFSVFFLK